MRICICSTRKCSRCGKCKRSTAENQEKYLAFVFLSTESGEVESPRALLPRTSNMNFSILFIFPFVSISPKFRPGLLFHRAMLLSGSGLSPWSLVSEPAKYAAIVSHHVNCSPDLPHSHLLKCLRERPLDALLSTPIRQPEFGNAFGPSVDGVVIGKCWRCRSFGCR